jgi:lipopolysaccharide transport system ATP-binding protein
MPPIISVENLGKKYILGHQSQERYTALRDVMANGVKKFAQKLRHPFAGQKDDPSMEEFWALKDLNFEIQQGDRVGIIGRNGAGKSTLLKILSRITEPTTGQVRIKGRVASLLEVGTGFHPELTGRENIYLNGAILGMSKAEIKRKFDEIVAFAEVERFLDTPVKRYSSGMYVRLAFSVAAHLEPEILIVDEVLAVGDVQFQKKCLGKMQQVGQEGRTVIFVSHNLGAIEQLCTSILLLEHGQKKAFGSDMQEIVKHYLFDADHEANSQTWENDSNKFDNEWFQPTRFYIGNAAGSAIIGPVPNNHELFLYVEGIAQKRDAALQIGFAVYDENGSLIFWSYHTDGEEKNWPVIEDAGTWLFCVQLPKNLFNEGVYRIDLGVALYCRAWLCEPGVNSPSVFLDIQGGLSESPYWSSKRPGVLAPILDWKIHPGSSENALRR